MRSLRWLVRTGTRSLIVLGIAAISLMLPDCTSRPSTPTDCDPRCEGEGGDPFAIGGSYPMGGSDPGGAGGVGGATGGSGGVTGGGGAGGDTMTSTTTCEPMTCGAQTCGVIQDGCGGEVTCGASCPSPQKCKTTCVCALAALDPLQCGGILLPAYCGGPGATLPEGCMKLGPGPDGKIVSCCPFDKVN